MDFIGSFLIRFHAFDGFPDFLVEFSILNNMNPSITGSVGINNTTVFAIVF